MKPFVVYSTIFILFLAACKKEVSNRNNELNNYIVNSLIQFQKKIQARGLNPNDLKVEDDLKQELKNIEHNWEDKNDNIGEFIQKLESIEKHKQLLDERKFLFENITPYLIQTKVDSAILLFDVSEDNLLPCVFLKDGDSARQIKINNYNPLTINITNPTWSNSNYPQTIDSKILGIYTVMVNGQDRQVAIEKKIICR